jgi:hypothetical protein
MHKDTPPYHPIHLPLNQEKCAIPIKEPKKKWWWSLFAIFPKNARWCCRCLYMLREKNEECKNGNGVLDVVDACFPALCCLW